MTTSTLPIPKNEAGSGNRTAIKRRADHDADPMELADAFEVNVKAANNPEQDASMDAFFISNHVPSKMGEPHKYINAIVTVNSSNIKVYDDNTGRELSASFVAKAREDEIKYVHAQKVYDKVQIGMCYSETGKEPIQTGWVNINKG